VRLQNDAPFGLGIVQHLEQQILVAVGRVVFEALRYIRPLRRDLGAVSVRRQKAADDGVALGSSASTMALHALSPQPSAN
jgi:hypothetical protein